MSSAGLELGRRLLLRRGGGACTAWSSASAPSPRRLSRPPSPPVLPALTTAPREAWSNFHHRGALGSRVFSRGCIGGSGGGGVGGRTSGHAHGYRHDGWPHAFGLGRVFSSSPSSAALGGASPKLSNAGDAARGKSPSGDGAGHGAAAAKAAKPEHEPERDFDLKIIQSVIPYIWPKDKPEHRLRVVGAVSLLVASKLLNVGTPFLFKHAIDGLAVSAAGTATGPAALAALPLGAAVALTPAAMLVGYGMARTGATLCNELRNATFAKVAQGAIRGVALRVFEHLHRLDLSFHLSRQTGAVTRTIERGTRGIQFILNSMVFNVVPTALEIGLVAYILGTRLGPEFAALTVGTIGAYGAFTLAVTQWRTQFRREMNRLENQVQALKS